MVKIVHCYPKTSKMVEKCENRPLGHWNLLNPDYVVYKVGIRPSNRFSATVLKIFGLSGSKIIKN